MWKTYHTIDITHKYLYRFFTLHFLEDFLATGDIYFARADRFLDEMECAHIQDLIDPTRTHLVEKRKKMYLMSCWHLANEESFALWNQNHALGLERRVVAVRFKRTDLLRYFKSSMVPHFGFYYKTNFYMGKVSYFPLAGATVQTLEKSRIHYPFFRKDSSFSFESEFRFVIEYDKDCKEAPQEYRFRLGEPSSLEFDLLLNPALPQLERTGILTAIRKYNLENRVKLASLQGWIKQK
jgi:hypothetical protein